MKIKALEVDPPKTELLQIHPLKLFSINDLSKLTDFPISTIHAKRKSGEIPPGVKIGKHRRWRYQAIADWLDELATAA